MTPVPFRIAVVLAAVVLSVDPAGAVDTLGVAHRHTNSGSLFGRIGWSNLQDSSRFVHVTDDSIWTSKIEPGADFLSPDSGARQLPYIVAEVEPGQLGRLLQSGMGAMIDDDGATAYAPDAEGHPIDRAVYVDLGAAIGINRLRFHPRLDRQHIRLFLQEFSVATSASDAIEGFETLLTFSSALPNVEPVVDRTFPSRLVRYLRFTPATERRWEIAEVEAFADGTTPLASYDSEPLPALVTTPVWGKIRFEGGSIAHADVIVHTRTGPDAELRHYFERLVEGSDDPGDLLRVSQGDYEDLAPEDRGPITANPTWSEWVTVTDGQVRSPSLHRYLQLRILFPISGVTLHKIVVEYLRQPIFRDLPAELSPTVVEPGRETDFTLSAIAYLEPFGGRPDSGFRTFDVITAAELAGVDDVLVDDVPVRFSARPTDTGFRVFLLGTRIESNGTFLQVRFRAAVYQDYTSFALAAVDTRIEDGRAEVAEQSGRGDDVDDELEGGSLVVRFDRDTGVQVLVEVEPSSPVVTPNGDGIHDEFEIGFSMLRVLAPVPVTLEVYDLRGRRVGRTEPIEAGAGRHRIVWDAVDAGGRPLPPGIYVYVLRADAAAGDRAHFGTVAVGF